MTNLFFQVSRAGLTIQARDKLSMQYAQKYLLIVIASIIIALVTMVLLMWIVKGSGLSTEILLILSEYKGN